MFLVLKRTGYQEKAPIKQKSEYFQDIQNTYYFYAALQGPLVLYNFTQIIQLLRTWYVSSHFSTFKKSSIIRKVTHISFFVSSKTNNLIKY